MGAGHPCLLTWLCPCQHEPACEGGAGSGGTGSRAGLWTGGGPGKDFSAPPECTSCHPAWGNLVQKDTVWGHFLHSLSAAVPQRLGRGPGLCPWTQRPSVPIWSGQKGREMTSGCSGFTVGALDPLYQQLYFSERVSWVCPEPSLSKPCLLFHCAPHCPGQQVCFSGPFLAPCPCPAS